MGKFKITMEVDFDSGEFNCDGDINITMKALGGYLIAKIGKYAEKVKINKIKIIQ